MPTQRDITTTARRGFTLVEMLTIISIIVILIGILLPAIGGAFNQVKRSSSLATIRAIDAACKFYKQDCQEFPDSSAGSYGPGGSQVALAGGSRLVECLTGYLDGPPGPDQDHHRGFGWRVGKGQVFGPYNETDKIKMQGTPPFFVDSFGNAILYYRATATTNNGVTTYSYNDADNASGPTGGVTAYATNGGTVMRTEFILITPGPDKVFKSVATDSNTDDITNLKD